MECEESFSVPTGLEISTTYSNAVYDVQLRVISSGQKVFKKASLLASCQASERKPDADEMWEYKVIAVGRQGTDESSLNDLGQQGWELAAAVPGAPNAGQTYILLFKRRNQSKDVHSTSQRPF